MKSLTTSMLVVLSRLTRELTAGEDGSMAIILVLFQFICSPTLAASSRRIRSALSSVLSIVLSKEGNYGGVETLQTHYSLLFYSQYVLNIRKMFDLDFKW